MEDEWFIYHVLVLDYAPTKKLLVANSYTANDKAPGGFTELTIRKGKRQKPHPLIN